jgi:CRISPR-associated protein Cmr6
MNIGFYYNRLYFNEIIALKEEFEKKKPLKEKESDDKEFLKKVKAVNKDRLTDFVSFDKIENGNSFFAQDNIEPVKLRTVYPGLATGIGMGHEADVKGELKLGFYFDYTTGVPVIPGSTVKGVLRSAFPQWDNHTNTPEKKKWAKTAYIYMALAKKENETWDELRKKWDSDEKEKQKDRITAIEKEIFDGIINGNNISLYQRDIFHDAYISAGTKEKPAPGRILGTDSITPHIQEGMSYEESMLRNPTPVSFLKILPDVEFSFNFILQDHTKDDSKLLSKNEKVALFKQILLDFGVGAKTNVGYGQFQ